MVEAALEVMPKNPANFNVDSVRVVKILGASMYDTAVVRGMVFGREPESIFFLIVSCCSQGIQDKGRYFHLPH